MSDIISSYYFTFSTTGDSDVDGILKWVSGAGNAYHSTESWQDDDDMLPNGSYIDEIQCQANKVAEVIATLKAEVERLKEELADCKADRLGLLKSIEKKGGGDNGT